MKPASTKTMPRTEKITLKAPLVEDTYQEDYLTSEGKPKPSKLNKFELLGKTFAY